HRNGETRTGLCRLCVRCAPYAWRVILAHLDLDAFFAAVEELEEPELKRVPLIVGGDPRGRGVVATANYRARAYGIHSAMSAAEGPGGGGPPLPARRLRAPAPQALLDVRGHRLGHRSRGRAHRGADRDGRGLPGAPRGRRRPPRRPGDRRGGAGVGARRDEP